MCQGLSIPDWNQHKVKWEHLKNILFPKAPGRKTIDILIGSDHPELTLALTEWYGPIGAPVTPLGWTCVERLPALSSAKRIIYTPGLHQSLSDPDLVRDRSRWTTTRNVGDRISWSEKFRRQSVETRGDLSYVKGRKVKTMDRGALCTSQIEALTSPPATPPGIWIFRKFCSNFPSEAEKLFKCPIISPFQVIKCPHPRETFQ